MSAAADAVIVEAPSFIDHVPQAYRSTEYSLEVLQVNVGLKCNLACRHCHVQAGPKRTELMSEHTMQACLDALDNCNFKTLDITGGAPEMNPHLPWFLAEASARGVNVIVRSNLVILTLPAYEHFLELYAKLGITVVASLPHYVQKNTDRQRGAGVYDASIVVLQKLNELGYGAGQGLQLDLVFNPGGAFLPPDQSQIEREYKKRLRDQFNIEFDNLLTITNNPLGRFAEALYEKDMLRAYMDKLIEAFNPETVPTMMCRTYLSVDHEGMCYDCDFNLAAGLRCSDKRSIFDYASKNVSLKRSVTFGNHCYACTAGAGSS